MTQPEFDQCPWGWCGSDPNRHSLLCLHSKIHLGISWGWTLSREEIFHDFGFDIWLRDEHGQVIERLNPGQFVVATPAQCCIGSKLCNICKERGVIDEAEDGEGE